MRFIWPMVYFWKLFLSVLFLLLLTSCLPQNQKIESFVQDNGNIGIYLCPHEDCETVFVNFLDSAQESIDCALFEIDLESVKQKLLEKSAKMDVRIVTDDQYFKQFNYSFVKADKSGLMHNKFCVVDGKKISSGSMNPTDNCAHKNNNNLLLIDSELLARNYQDEFQEMWNGTFKKGSKVIIPKIMLGNVSIENYFCPEDFCAERVKDELKKAEKSIHFMTFSFTHQGIANMLLMKNLENVSIQGVMEAKQVSKYSKFEQLLYNEINVLKDGNKYNLHHKVFIIDGKCVVTGSFNPTAGGDKSNDENVLIICDEELAQRFEDEFEIVWDEAENKNQTQ